jgi:Na+:H+ antiporter, NhaA family
MLCLNVLGVRRWWVFGLAGLVLWYFVLESGVHATIAGVVGAMTIPASTRLNSREFASHAGRLVNLSVRSGTDGVHTDHGTQQAAITAIERLAENAQSPLQRLERGMVPLSAFVVVPVFAFANAGVALGDTVAVALRDPEAWGIFLGLIVGKTIGILGFSWVAVASRVCILPTFVTWRHMLGAAMLGGIGFTMSLFIAHLAFGASVRLEIAKFAVLSGSLAAAILGAGVLMTCPRRPDLDQHDAPSTLP